MKILDRKKIKYSYSDPFFKKIRQGRKNIKPIKSIKLSSSNLKKYDCAILITDHDNFNYKLIAKSSIIVFDTRGVYKKLKNNRFKNIVTV